MNTYYFELTDTFGGEANYSWVKRYQVDSKSLLGALSKLSRYTGFNFRFNGWRYNAKHCCVCCFLLDNEALNYYKFKQI